MSGERRASILIVDDSLTMRGMIRSALTDGGYDVIEARDGCEGIARLREAAPHAIISDVNMPNMNGLDFVRTVRQDPRFAATPILFLTTESGTDFKAAGKAAGATGWIVKPFRPDALRQVVAKVLQKQQAVSSQPSAVSSTPEADG